MDGRGAEDDTAGNVPIAPWLRRTENHDEMDPDMMIAIIASRIDSPLFHKPPPLR